LLGLSVSDAGRMERTFSTVKTHSLSSGRNRKYKYDIKINLYKNDVQIMKNIKSFWSSWIN